MLRLFKIILASILIFLFSANSVATEPPVVINDNSQLMVEREPVSLSRHESRAREAAVKVAAPDGSGYGSGTYSTISGKHVVLTAAHVIRDNPFMVVLGRFGEVVFGEVAYVDPANDFAVLVIPELQSRTAVPFRPSRKSLESLIGVRVHYTGFPNSHDLFSVRGYVSGIEEGNRNALLINGYAWMGASGSGIFDSNGNFIGTLVAVDIGTWRNPQIVETVVWASPVANFNIKAIEEHIRLYRVEIPEYRDK